MVTVGPALAGLLVASVGIPWTYTVDVLLFTAAFLGIFTLPSILPEGERQRAGLKSVVQGLRFLKSAPNLSMTQHAITIRPLCFSVKTFKKLDKNMQAAVLKAGQEAGAYGRQVESSEDEAKLVALEKAGKLKRVPFQGRDQMKKLVDPVMAEYAKEIGAEQLLAKINAIK